MGEDEVPAAIIPVKKYMERGPEFFNCRLLVPHPPVSWDKQTRSRIHKHTVSLRFLGIILRVFRLQVSVYNVYIANQY
jgi:hypothetical protein